VYMIEELEQVNIHTNKTSNAVLIFCQNGLYLLYMKTTVSRVKKCQLVYSVFKVVNTMLR